LRIKHTVTGEVFLIGKRTEGTESIGGAERNLRCEIADRMPLLDTRRSGNAQMTRDEETLMERGRDQSVPSKRRGVELHPKKKKGCESKEGEFKRQLSGRRAKGGKEEGNSEVVGAIRGRWKPDAAVAGTTTLLKESKALKDKVT